MQKICKGDEVVVIAGKNKGQRGRVLKVLPQDDKALVENVNTVKKAVRPDPNTNREGGIIEQERPLAVSNLMVYNPATGKGERVVFKIGEDGARFRAFKDGSRVGSK